MCNAARLSPVGSKPLTQRTHYVVSLILEKRLCMGCALYRKCRVQIPYCVMFIKRSENDDTAMDTFERWLSANHGIGASEIFTIAGVWERDPRFYTANCLSDLDEQR
jgi:hypothetical protein